jgi:hypothetical protein
MEEVMAFPDGRQKECNLTVSQAAPEPTQWLKAWASTPGLVWSKGGRTFTGSFPSS